MRIQLTDNIERRRKGKRRIQVGFVRRDQLFVQPSPAASIIYNIHDTVDQLDLIYYCWEVALFKGTPKRHNDYVGDDITHSPQDPLINLFEVSPIVERDLDVL